MISVTPMDATVTCNKCAAEFPTRRERFESSTGSLNRVSYEAEQAGWLVSTHGDLCNQCAIEQVPT